MLCYHQTLMNMKASILSLSALFLLVFFFPRKGYSQEQAQQFQARIEKVHFILPGKAGSQMFVPVSPSQIGKLQVDMHWNGGKLPLEITLKVYQDAIPAQVVRNNSAILHYTFVQRDLNHPKDLGLIVRNVSGGSVEGWVVLTYLNESIPDRFARR